mmetsp:Transcript_32906/g.66812  ORF Transcript_32906/g.66812 Transcript_32906/m.66812 type:complete len:227 (-) Transcript_32906:669-1349(-)
MSSECTTMLPVNPRSMAEMSVWMTSMVGFTQMILVVSMLKTENISTMTKTSLKGAQMLIERNSLRTRSIKSGSMLSWSKKQYESVSLSSPSTIDDPRTFCISRQESTKAKMQNTQLSCFGRAFPRVGFATFSSSPLSFGVLGGAPSPEGVTGSAFSISLSSAAPRRAPSMTQMAAKNERPWKIRSVRFTAKRNSGSSLIDTMSSHARLRHWADPVPETTACMTHMQ